MEAEAGSPLEVVPAGKWPEDSPLVEGDIPEEGSPGEDILPAVGILPEVEDPLVAGIPPEVGDHLVEGILPEVGDLPEGSQHLHTNTKDSNN